MPTIGIAGVALAGKTTTLQRLGALLGLHLTSYASEFDRILVASRPELRIVTMPGAIWHKYRFRRMLVGCDALICLVETQPEREESHQEEYGWFADAIQQTPRIFQINKVDLAPAEGVRPILPSLGWEPGIEVHETVASTGAGIDHLIGGIRALLERHGVGDVIAARLQQAFPGTAPELLEALDRRWLGWGRSGIVVCPRDAVRSTARVGSRGAVTIREARPIPIGQRDDDVPFALPPLPPTRLSRDTLLAETRRALLPEEQARVEDRCGDDLEDRLVDCPTCQQRLAITARFDGTRWSLSAS